MRKMLEKGFAGLKRLTWGWWFLIILIIIWVISYESESQTREEIKQNPGKIKGIITSTGIGKSSELYYKYMIDNVTYTGHDSPNKGLRVGDSIWVIYSKQDHAKSYILPIR